MLHKGVVTLLSSLVIQLTERLHVRHESKPIRFTLFLNYELSLS